MRGVRRYLHPSVKCPTMNIRLLLFCIKIITILKISCKVYSYNHYYFRYYYFYYYCYFQKLTHVVIALLLLRRLISDIIIFKIYLTLFLSLSLLIIGLSIPLLSLFLFLLQVLRLVSVFFSFLVFYYFFLARLPFLFAGVCAWVCLCVFYDLCIES